jgi:hypothetical protein
MAWPGARRILRFTFTPESAWREAAGSRVPRAVMRHLGPLALIPAAVAALLTVTHGEFIPAAWLTPLAADSPFALALSGEPSGLAVPLTPIAERASTLTTVATALLAYAATWLAVASGAATLNVLLPLFSGRRNLHSCMMVASYSATPLLISSVTLLHPSLVPIIALAAMHACYVAYLGLAAMLGVPRGEAGMCLGITTIAALLLGQLAGYGAGTVFSVIGR